MNDSFLRGRVAAGVLLALIVFAAAVMVQQAGKMGAGRLTRFEAVGQ